MKSNSNDSIKILSIDAKDLYISNHYIKPSPTGYNIRYANGTINLKKFVNTFDNSLELPKLREVYQKIYNKTDFGFIENGKEYSQRIINVTFKYSNKEFNKFSSRKNNKTNTNSINDKKNKIEQSTYVKFGYKVDELAFDDCICIISGQLVGIQTGIEVISPADKKVLGKYFYFENNMYKAKSNITPIHTVDKLRADLYKNGFMCDGIKYIRYKRSSGSGRKGKCLFIDENLYYDIHKWECCGLKIAEGQDIDLAAFESYISLNLSSIIDTIEIQPKNILLIDDYESSFKDDVITVSIDNENKLKAETKNTTITNSIWDGQSLMDYSLFGKYKQYGFLLLRNRFFKSACFNCNISKWFKDNNITDISQLKGKTLATRIEDIKLITTPSSIKYLKFGSFEQWLDNIESTFGVVKHEKPTHFFDGKLVQTHYQLLNTLQMNEKETQALVQPSLDYLNSLQTDIDVLRYQIKYPDEVKFFDNKPLMTRSDIVYALLGVNDNFAKTKIYYNFKHELSKSFKNNLRHGHLLINGNYSVLFGNGIEMLQSAIGTFDGTSQIGIGNVHSKRFEYGTTLLGSRSPHVCASNVLLCHNAKNEMLDTYFNFTDGIVAVNSIGECLLDRLSGSDYDSDSLMLTDNKILIEVAKKNYHLFKPCVNQVSSSKRKRKYTCAEKTDLDVKTSVNKIGEIINLSQELNTQFWHRFNNGETYEDLQELYYDIAKLDILSGVAIDMAKKEFVIDCNKEITEIKLKYIQYDENNKQIKPNFFGVIAKSKGYFDSNRKAYVRHKTTMDYLQKSINNYKSKRVNIQTYSKIIDLFDKTNYNCYNVKRSQVHRIIDLIRKTRNDISCIWQDDNIDSKFTKMEMVNDLINNVVEYINSIKISNNTMLCLIMQLEKKENSDISGTLFNILFHTANRDFYNLIKNSTNNIHNLVQDDNGDVEFYDINFNRNKISNAQNYIDANKQIIA